MVEGDEGVVLPEVVEDPSILMIDAISVESEDIMHMIADVVGVADADLGKESTMINLCFFFALYQSVLCL